MEPNRGLHRPHGRLHELLCDADGGAIGGDGAGKIQGADPAKWREGRLDGSGTSGRKIVDCSRFMVETAKSLRQLHVRYVPRRGAGRIYPAYMASHVRFAPPYLPNSHKTAR
jgi:hypothetical protein